MARKINEKIMEIPLEELEELSCDVCNKQMLRGIEDDDLIDIGKLTISTTEKRFVLADQVTEETEFKKENMDLCAICYDKIKAVVKKHCGATPSFYFDGTAMSDEAIEEME